jgi:hypothetical protein
VLLGQYEALIAAAPYIASFATSLIGSSQDKPCSPPVQVPPGYVPEPPGRPNNYTPQPMHYVNPCTGHGIRVGRLGCQLHETGTWTPDDLREAGLSCLSGLSLGGVPMTWIMVGGGALLLLVLVLALTGR